MSSTKTKVAGGSSAVLASIIAAIFAMEGGYVFNPSDPGGETNHGITKAVAVDYGYTGSMRALDKDTATNIYVTNYINKPGYRELIAISHVVGHKVVDAGVNAGTSRSSRWLQEALNSLNRGGKDYPPIYVDGIVGSGTINAYAGLQKARGKVLACEMVIKLMDAQQAAHYMSLKHLSMFTPGWVSHRIGNVPVSRCKEEL